jgi:hypothetical protein
MHPAIAPGSMKSLAVQRLSGFDQRLSTVLPCIRHDSPEPSRLTGRA